MRDLSIYPHPATYGLALFDATPLAPMPSAVERRTESSGIICLQDPSIQQEKSSC
jgi:hypothetical protein